MIRAFVLAVGLALAAQSGKPAHTVPPPADLDTLLAPVALYPDQVLGPMLISAGNPATVGALNEWLRSHEGLKGSDLQAAVATAGFGDSYAALVLFPDVVNWMASQTDWTTKVGKAFAADRSAVFASIQRLRKKAQTAGTLKSTPQQTVETKQTSGGDNVIVIEPANPQVVYVPQYNPTVVYTQPSTVVVQQSHSSSDAALAGVIGFTAGIAIGAAIDNNYYGPYGWHGGYMYNDGWDDWYDNREDAREDWQDHREDMADEYGDRAKNAQENRTDRRENTSQQRTDRQQNRQQSGTTGQTQRQQQRSTSTPSATTQSTGARTQETRGFSGDARSSTARSGTASTAFSGYSSGKSERAASSRGQSSRSSSRGGGSRRR
jgi:hypothetical protein